MNGGEYSARSAVKFIQPRLISGLAVLLLFPATVRAGGVVTNCTEAALRAAMTGGGTVTFACLGSGNAGQPCRLLSSSDMLNWVQIAATTIGSGGTVQFIVSRAPGPACWFYRLAMP
jgi:hypothetical protein